MGRVPSQDLVGAVPQFPVDRCQDRLDGAPGGLNRDVKTLQDFPFVLVHRSSFVEAPLGVRAEFGLRSYTRS